MLKAALMDSWVTPAMLEIMCPAGTRFDPNDPWLYQYFKNSANQGKAHTVKLLLNHELNSNFDHGDSEPLLITALDRF